MKKIEYQFDELESANGLHELRRDMKWILLEMRALNGLILKKPAACDVPELAGLMTKPVATSKYSQLPPSATEKAPCYISECLFLGLVQAVEDFGLLKDESESILNAGEGNTDKVPPAIKVRAQDVYDQMRKAELFSRTESSLRQCIL